MRRLIGLLLCGAAGCFSPAPPSGAYLCSAADSACPSGQHCTCGLCVTHDSDAACSFAVTVPGTPAACGATGPKLAPAAGAMPMVVSEHQPFALTVQACTQAGQPATGFAGAVALTADWGNVDPPTVSLAGGTASVMVALNRETRPDQEIHLTAQFAGNSGRSGVAPQIRALHFTADAAAIVPPAGARTPFGWADVVAGEPDVVVDGSGYRMYFLGAGRSTGSSGAVGLANSSDGIHFTPTASPVLNLASTLIGAPSVFTSPDGTSAMAVSLDGSDLGLASAADATSPFMLDADNGGKILTPDQCSYCAGGLNFPWVVPNPLAAAGQGGWLLFFSAEHDNPLTKTKSFAIGIAESSDGKNFTPEPASLTSDEGGEQNLLAPRVLVDGTVLKMWYAYQPALSAASGGGCQGGLCIGYATSSDGLFWIRSPDNPVLAPGTASWESGGTEIIPGSVVPLDGKSLSSGLALYYTALHSAGVNGAPAPNGVGRATAHPGK